jgi:hypothetical protein
VDIGEFELPVHFWKFEMRARGQVSEQLEKCGSSKCCQTKHPVLVSPFKNVNCQFEPTASRARSISASSRFSKQPTYLSGAEIEDALQDSHNKELMRDLAE